MLDEKGRLFGKINIVDLLIVLVVIAAVAFVGIKYVLPKESNVELADIEMKVYIDNTFKFVESELKEGASVYDSTDKVTIGTCKSWESRPYYEAVSGTGDVAPQMALIENKCTVELVIDAKGQMTDYGANIGGFRFGLGHTMVIYVGECKLFCAVESITVK